MIKKLLGIFAVMLAVAAVALAGFWISRPGDLSFDELKATIPNSEFSKFATVDGVKLHYQEKGSGEPLILIHGFTSSTYTWKDVFLPLSKKYRVIAVDLKGHGFSAKPDGDYTRREQARIVSGLMDRIGVKHAWIAGNSMGGETAINIALKNPEKVKGLILIDSAGVKKTGGTSVAPWYLKIPALGRLFTSLSLTSDGLIRDGLERSYFDDSKITDETVAYYHAPLMTSNGQRAAILANLQWSMFPIENSLRLVDKPVLIIWGAHDQVIPLETGRKMNSLIKGSKLEVLENSGHVPQEENPEEVIALIENFIDSQSHVGK